MVYGVPGCLSSRTNWVPPPPPPQGRIAPPPFRSKGGKQQRSLADEGGWWDPIPTKGQKLYGLRFFIILKFFQENEFSTWSDQRGSFSAASRLFWKINVTVIIVIILIFYPSHSNTILFCTKTIASCAVGFFFWQGPFAFIFGLLMMLSSLSIFNADMHKTFRRVNCKGIFYSNCDCSSLRYNRLIFYLIAEH